MFNTIGYIIDIKDSAFIQVTTHLTGQPDFDPKIPPPYYFKLGVLSTVDIDAKEVHIDMSDKIPVGNVGDGVAKNWTAARLMATLYGLDILSMVICKVVKCENILEILYFVYFYVE